MRNAEVIRQWQIQREIESKRAGDTIHELATLDHVNHARNRVMAGITSYAHKQEALDVRIDDTRHALAAATAAEPQDFDRIDALEEELDWSTRIFQDRQQSLTYVCETPVILEQRVFALARSIAARLPQ